MPVHSNQVPLDTAKQWAKKLVKSSKSINPAHPFTLSQAQLAISQMLSFKHWHDLEASLGKPVEPAINPVGISYTGAHPQTPDAWIEFWAGALLFEGSTDVYIECKKDMRVNLRIHGTPFEYYAFPASDVIAAMIPILPKEIAENFIQHNGSFFEYSSGKLSIPGNAQKWRQEIDARFQFLPLYSGGWAIVLQTRPLFQNTMQIDSMQLPDDIVNALKTLSTRSGLFLCSGTAGSGKSTLMRALLEYRGAQSSDGKCYVVGDDRGRLEGLLHTSSIPVKSDTDNLNAISTSALPAMRGGADVLGIGEIRDTHSAKASIKAVQTVPTVISTTHSTENGVIDRLGDLCAHPWENALSGWTHSKLLGVLCQHCATTHPDGTKKRSQDGCAHCRGIGISGRQLVLDIWAVENGKPVRLFSKLDQTRDMVRQGMVDLENAEDLLGRLY